MERPPDSPSKGFQQDDLELLHSGILADGIIKCQGRTWKVHRAVLSSRLEWFKKAFCGPFAEATSGEVEFPEAEPDVVDITIRHLYREDLDVETLNTPLLCIRSWKLADYLRLDTLKSLARSALNDHLHAMLLLAYSDQDLEDVEPKPVWLTHFMDAFREVCDHTVLRPLQAEFVTFLWVTRSDMLYLSEVWETLDEHKDVRAQLLELLIDDRNAVQTLLVPLQYRIDYAIRNRAPSRFLQIDNCSTCKGEYFHDHRPWFSNPLPMKGNIRYSDIGEQFWCKDCADNINSSRSWGWRPEKNSTDKTFRLEAWSW